MCEFACIINRSGEEVDVEFGGNPTDWTIFDIESDAATDFIMQLCAIERERAEGYDGAFETKSEFGAFGIA